MHGAEHPRPEPARWQDQAACAGKPPVVFYPDVAGPNNTAAARAICATCPVRLDCLDHAIATSEPDGIWGGMDAKERMSEKRRRRRRQRKEMAA